METVILVIHLLLALAIIGLVLLQKSEGGGLGIGGGSGGMGSFATAGQTANALTRLTAYCALGFFITSLTLAVLAGNNGSSKSLLENLDNPPAAVDSSAQKSDNKLPEAKASGDDSKAPSAPISE
ncbi:MAG: preprotein translocase subunit SecG [Alphaproteobacteria bacterium]|nr:preprotein translocase subunit SecG [Alphaproteobacteria bacterium]